MNHVTEIKIENITFFNSKPSFFTELLFNFFKKEDIF